MQNYKSIKVKIKNEVQEKLVTNGSDDTEDVYSAIDECIQRESHRTYMPHEDKLQLRKEIYYAIKGLDVLSEIMEDKGISEIMVNGPDRIFIEKDGKLSPSKKCFDSVETLNEIIQKIVAYANRTVNLASPIVDARLPDGSRVNVVLSPISLDGPILTIRRFPEKPLTVEKLIEIGAINDEIVKFLRDAVNAKYNILISGGTGAGKSTLLNTLSSFIPPTERIITIEDSAELKIQGIDNLVRLETRNSNTDGCSEITIRDLIKAALRMRPSRVIVGEVRGAEAIDMLQAFSIGMDGSMSTIHANSAVDALSRLETLIMLNSENIPLNAIRRQISSSVDILIQLSRQRDSSRKLIEIREVLEYMDGVISTNLLYEFRNGQFIKKNELKNTFKMERAGIM